MKTKTTDGKTVVVATEQDLRTLDRAIDVLIEYKARTTDLDNLSMTRETIDGLRCVISEFGPVSELTPLADRPEKAAKPPPAK